MQPTTPARSANPLRTTGSRLLLIAALILACSALLQPTVMARATTGATLPSADPGQPGLLIALSSQCTTICYVDATSGSDANDGSSQATAVKTIQEAVNRVLPTGTVAVAAGTYSEQIDIDKPLTLAGAGEGSTTIQAPTTLASKFTVSGMNNRPVIYAHDAAEIIIQDLTVDGAGVGNANYRFMGIAFYNAGGAVSATTIAHIRNTPLDGTQHGVGLYALNDVSQARSITISDNTIFDYQKNGMSVIGAGLSATITGNTVTGAGPLGLGLPAQNGIQVSGGAVAPLISGNSVSGHFYTGPNWSAAGLLLYAPGSGAHAIRDNTLVGNQVGISANDATEVELIGNEIRDALVEGTESYGVFIYTLGAVSTAGSVSGNTISGQTYGLMVYDYYPATGGAPAVDAAFNRIVGNTVAGLSANVPTAAENNWWGCNAGPGAAGCDALESDPAGVVDADPWLVLSLEADPPALATGGAASLTASLTGNSDGQDTSDLGAVPDITPATFSATLGDVAPASATTTGGAATTTFTAGSSVGDATLTATVDNQSVSASVAVAHPASALAVAPAALSFSAWEGGTSPAASELTISNTAAGGPLAWSVSAPSYGQGATGWLSCAPGSGATLAPGASATVTCSATTGSLAAGSYSASFAVSSDTPGVTGSPQTVNVTLQVKPAPRISFSAAALTLTTGTGGQLSVRLDAAQAGDTLIVLVSSAPGVAGVPARITIPAGQLAASVPVQSLAVGGPATITAALPAALGGGEATASVTITPATIYMPLIVR